MNSAFLQGDKDNLYLTDAGLETFLVYMERVDLTHFAAFYLIDSVQGKESLRAYYQRYVDIAVRYGHGLILESPTWRASPDWGRRLGYSLQGLQQANLNCVALMQQLRDGSDHNMPRIISGCVGPRNDGYVAEPTMIAAEAQAYHAWQINTFAQAKVDMISAMTMTNIPEVVGITRAASAAELPCAISFTVEMDGKLPTGETLRYAIQTVDDHTNNGPAYYMINCAHPSHFVDTLSAGTWVKRIRGIRANASKCSHAELDLAEELDSGNPMELAIYYRQLRERFPHFNVLGGCCGTDHRHIEAICSELAKQ